MRFIYFLVFGEYFCSKGVSLSDIGFTIIFRKIIRNRMSGDL